MPKMMTKGAKNSRLRCRYNYNFFYLKQLQKFLAQLTILCKLSRTQESVNYTVLFGAPLERGHDAIGRPEARSIIGT